MDRRGNRSGLDAVALAEQVADGLLPPDEAARAAVRVRRLAWDDRALAPVHHVPRWFGEPALVWEPVPRVALLRCLFGNPFRPVTADPAWLAWNGGTLGRLARALYDEHAFDRLPILADALEDAGCADADLLAHARGPGPHARACWVVDLLLENE
jgi:hypothetical protein